MITVTATWGDWKFNERVGSDKEKVVHPTVGRDRPLVIHCSTPYTAAIMEGILKRLGCDVTKEES